MNGTYVFWHGWQGSGLFLRRLLVSALAWWLLTGGRPDSWIVGVPAIVAAAGFSACVLPPLPFSLRGAVRFAAFFAVSSLRGALDVSRRALHWRLPLDPGVLEHQTRLGLPAAVVAMANTTSLLPGTMVADLTEDRLLVHALDAGSDIAANLEQAERHVAMLFGLTPGAAPGGGGRAA